ncbi:MAG: MBL fold metallo-hydrolase [Eubacteriales bacterium]|nr:MBL fold metallo-hydrolase [Eubacteriales bacterium]
MNFYRSEKVTGTVTAIYSLTGEILYLVEGEKEAVLIDTCIGIGHLRDFVEWLTAKPLRVLLTHGHVDHAMGAPEFERVYLNLRDRELYQRQSSLEERRGYLRAGLGEAADQWKESDFVPQERDKEFLPLSDGMVFALGGVTIEAYEMPGHTKGSMVFLIREEGILILGDACNNSTFLFDQDSSSVEEYRETVRRTKERLEGSYRRVFLSHHVRETDPQIMENMIGVCGDVLAGEADDLPFSFMGRQAYIAKRCNERFEREDGKSGNLIYSRERVRGSL